ncbi:MAG TPA: benzoate-CoA ligase family protein [Acidimicrobiia bacterium]|nr:benzoate-CoA ligase family protein [Acidimicrobiia bacterium]
MEDRYNASTLLDRNLDAGRGESTAAITDEGDPLSFGEMCRSACRVASRLSDLGVRRENRILMVLDDTPAFPATFLGAMRMGAVPIPTNFLARADDFSYFLDDSYATVAVVDAAFMDKLAPVLAGHPQVAVVVANGAAADGHSIDEWLEDGEDEVDPVATHPEDMAFWLYSSGSTGRPKGVVHSHTDLRFTCETYAAEILETGPDDIHFSTTKMFHAYGLGNSLSFPLWSGATAVYMTGRPTPERALAKVAEQEPTLLFSVPTLYNMMMNHAAFAATDFSSVRLGVSAAEPLPPEVWRRFHDATGVEILDGIGSTEMLHIYCSNRASHVRPGTSGGPVPGYDLEIRDEDGHRLGLGQSGELMVRGGSQFSYYWHQGAKTRSSLRGEWFASGDRYHQAEDGSFGYEGRVDDMMKVGGNWVSPIEIENRLMEHPGVREAAVVGVEVDGLMRIKAFVIAQTEPDDELPDVLRAWCKDALQRYQYPQYVEFVDDFPRTATGKIQRFKLRGVGDREEALLG